MKLISNLINSYLKQQIITKTIELSQRLTKENVLFKKYLKLIEDYEAIEDNGKRVVSVREMKNKFRNICWTCYHRFRQLTIDLRDKFAINSELDEESNHLCCLPLEAFDRFLAEDSTDLSLSLIKV